ncbi:putative N-acetyltransferase YhbS [Hasllibacter halocynthiae]|uniref:Putative N-acetyltransferase YhbS n=1 Tax=Hasllibacter halocynthiae TaxID=595589 RepID=A0A2T0X6C4_9RHOB|nr:GNAT family N-acetyltransferase [Hasllibacter halocynthiae]PRY94424.1 putative N-acetyltransferase YhbS [Hasllibacter halocynthiae]
MRLRQEEEGDGAAVETLYDLAFGPGRRALSSYRLRRGPPVRGCGHVVDAGEAAAGLAGAIRAWPVAVGGAPALLVGPVAVHPAHQGEGWGGALMAAALGAAAAGWRRALLVGDAPYYARFGFAPLAGVLMPPPTDPARVLGLALAPGAWEGVAGPVLPAPLASGCADTI